MAERTIQAANELKHERSTAMGRLDNKVAIITGSTSGIGKASAELFAKEGAKVVVCGRREALGEEVVNGIREAGGTADYYKLDASSEDSIKGLVEFTLEKYGQVDILVNNVGGGRNGLLHTLTSEDFDHVVAIDLKSFFLGMKYVIPAMLEQGGGSIINVASAAVHSVPPTTSLYQMSKAGVITLSRVAAKEYAANGIRVNVVNPGYTDTDIFTSMDEERKAAMAASLPMKRMAQPIEVAYPILFLASDEASYVSGRELNVCGAWAL